MAMPLPMLMTALTSMPTMVMAMTMTMAMMMHHDHHHYHVTGCSSTRHHGYDVTAMWVAKAMQMPILLTDIISMMHDEG